MTSVTALGLLAVAALTMYAVLRVPASARRQLMAKLAAAWRQSTSGNSASSNSAGVEVPAALVPVVGSPAPHQLSLPPALTGRHAAVAGSAVRLFDDAGLAHLGRFFAERDRLAPGEAALPGLIATLDPARWAAVWNIYMPDGAHVPLLLLGPNGAFVLVPCASEFIDQDENRLHAGADAAEALLQRIIGYPDPVRRALVFASSDFTARQFNMTLSAGVKACRPTWTVGSLTWREWLDHYDDRGFTAADLQAVSAAVAATAVERYGGEIPQILKDARRG